MFRVDITEETVQRILTRVRQARWPDRLDATDWRYGADWDCLKALAEYWTTSYDWRKSEVALNRYPQFLTRVAEFDIHYYHVRGDGKNSLPIILTHGWPGSVAEFLGAIQPLSEAGFDVVVPSLPGFGFSSKPKGAPVGPAGTARLWHRLMTEVLGYKTYGAQGGDWGMRVSIQLARQFPDAVAGIHLNGASSITPPDTDEERDWARAAAAWRDTEADYFREQQRKPQTVAFALADNPLGTAAWIVEKLKAWSDSGDDLDRTLSKDQVLTNLMIYLVTETAGTGVWFYRGAAEEGPPSGGKLTTPTGFAAFPREMPVLSPPRSLLERDFNLVRYTKMPRGGHFGCWEQPGLFVEDVIAFFRTLRDLRPADGSRES